MLKRLLVTLLTALALLVSAATADASLTFYYTAPSNAGATYQQTVFCGRGSPNQSNDCGGFWNSQAPYEADYSHSYCWIYGLTGAPSNNVTWNVGASTGLATTPSQNAGVSQTANTPACQVAGTAGGAYLNGTWLPTGQHLQGYGIEANWCPIAGCNPLVSPVYHPFAGQPSSAYLRYQTTWHLGGWGTFGGGIGYSQNCVSLRDDASGQTINWCPESWDSRGEAQGVAITGDSVNGWNVTVPMSVGSIGAASNGNKFGVLGCNSQNRQHSLGYGDYFMEYLPWDISIDSSGHRAGLLDLIQYINFVYLGPNHQPLMSTNQANWALTGVGAGAEMTDTSHDSSLSTYVKDTIASFDTAPCTVSAPY